LVNAFGAAVADVFEETVVALAAMRCTGDAFRAGHAEHGEAADDGGEVETEMVRRRLIATLTRGS
jgi:hypothetical protein